MCSPHPCTLKNRKTEERSDCKLCAPGPCVMSKARTRSANRAASDCRVCKGPCVMKRSQSQSSDCKVCAPKPCVLKTKGKEEECRYCPPGKCIKKKPAGDPGVCRVCAPNPCILKKSEGSECKVCAPHPCVLLSSKGTPLKSPKLVARSKSVSGDSSCRLCAPNPCIMKKKEELCPHCKHLHPCAFKWKPNQRSSLRILSNLSNQLIIATLYKTEILR